MLPVPLRLLVLSSLLSAVSCGREPLARSSGGLELDARELALPNAFVGYSSRATVEVRNSARATRTAAVEAASPFSVTSGSVEVGGGTTLSLEVTFSPEAPGPSSGVLLLVVDGEPTEIALTGTGQRKPTCLAAGACRASTFDPATGACVESVLADDSACDPGNSCLERGRCIAGACLGSARNCDDGNRCSADSCDPASGCLHQDIGAQCPIPSEPCRVAVCNPATGCGAADAPDGTACGPADCDTARVCMAGACREVAVPEGATCAPESPCQAKGTCHAHVCEKPLAAPLAAVWTYQVPAGRTLYFNGLADAQDNLYWAECTSAPACDLVSTTSAGFVRYRVALDATVRSVPQSQYSPGLLILADGLVVSALGANEVEARHASDGSLAWTVGIEVLLSFAASEPCAGGVGEPGPLADDGRGHLYARVRAYQTCFPAVGGDALSSLDLAAGAVRWTTAASSRLDALAVDELGNAYVSGTLPADGGTFWGVASYGVDGLERWRSDVAGYPASLSVAGGRVAGVRGTLLDASDGGLVSATPPVWGCGSVAGREPLLGAGVGVTFGQDYGCCGECELCDTVDVPALPPFTVSGFRPSDGAQLWTLNVTSGYGQPYYSPAVSSPALGKNGDLVFAVTPGMYAPPSPSNPPLLRAFTATGQERFSCELPVESAYSTVSYAGFAALLTGRWAVAAQPVCLSCMVEPPAELRVFDVPGYELGNSGWVTTGGSNRRSGRPR